MTSPPRLTAAHLAPPKETAGSSGEQTPTDSATYRARGIGMFHHGHDEDGDDVGALSGSWWGDRAKEGNRPWHNPPK